MKLLDVALPTGHGMGFAIGVGLVPMMPVSPCLFLALATPAIALVGPAEETAAVIEDTSPADRLESRLMVRVEIDGGEAVAEALHEELVGSLREAGASELPGVEPLELVISTDPQSLDTYAVVYVHRGVTLQTWTCACSGEELRVRLRAATPAVWQAASAAATPAPPEPAVVAPPPKDPGLDTGEPGNGMWIAGVATTSVGTGLAVGQSVLIILNAADDKDIKALPVGVLATGVAMVATGGLLWALANRKRKGAYVGVGVGKGVVVTLQGRF